MNNRLFTLFFSLSILLHYIFAFDLEEFKQKLQAYKEENNQLNFLGETENLNEDNDRNLSSEEIIVRKG